MRLFDVMLLEIAMFREILKHALLLIGMELEEKLCQALAPRVPDEKPQPWTFKDAAHEKDER